MHLALAALGPDAALADRVAAAADEARRRGARRQAALLAGHALRLTPAGANERPARVLVLAERLDDAGELRRMTALVQDELGSLPPGPLRAHAWVLLSESEAVSSRKDQDRYLDRALADCAGDRNLRARVLAKKAGHAAAAAVSQLGQAEAWALEALECATDAAPRRYALWSLAWARGLSGRPLDELCAQSAVARDPTAYISASPERVAAKRLLWRGELAGARVALRQLGELADERGDLTSYAMIRMHLIEVELRCGKLAAAARLLDEWAESSDFETQFRPQYPRCRSLLHAVSGNHEDATRWATETIRLANAAGSGWDELEARHALGIAALVEPAPDDAVAELWRVWEHCEEQGVREPGAFPVAPDLVEALVELGRFEDAGEIVERLRVRAEEQDHPWGRATVHRCGAVLALARDGYDEASAHRLGEAATELHALEARFDGVRCLLALGRAQRRAKQWRDARETLERTVASFAELGADGWVQRAKSELARVGGRRRADGELTPSERRVIELAAQGMSNKKIAAALYVTINTVEVHLSRAYAKLGVRSRGQLAKRLAAGA
jgi:DNA-binding CsgD family transcriptional regulator